MEVPPPPPPSSSEEKRENALKVKRGEGGEGVCNPTRFQPGQKEKKEKFTSGLNKILLLSGKGGALREGRGGGKKPSEPIFAQRGKGNEPRPPRNSLSSRRFEKKKKRTWGKRGKKVRVVGPKNVGGKGGGSPRQTSPRRKTNRGGSGREGNSGGHQGGGSK